MLTSDFGGSYHVPQKSAHCSSPHLPPHYIQTTTSNSEARILQTARDCKPLHNMVQHWLIQPAQRNWRCCHCRLEQKSGRDLTLSMRVQIITEWVICLWPPLSLSRSLFPSPFYSPQTPAQISLSLSLLLATDSRPRSGHYHRLRVSVWALSPISP